MSSADILQANLRSNPIFYQDGQLLQYRGTSTAFTSAPRLASPCARQLMLVSNLVDRFRINARRTDGVTRAEQRSGGPGQDAVHGESTTFTQAHSAWRPRWFFINIREASKVDSWSISWTRTRSAS